MSNLVDYTDTFGNCIRCEGLGRNVLILRKLDKPTKRFDGKQASYVVDHRWLSCTCQHPKDEAWACVQGNDLTLWQHKEIKAVLKTGKLFEFFSICS